ncbi:Hypothetical predicted protein [Xyrichtys novacula]|uniref:Uncharacterized protein n=1 Tax=Xyrichtys novacula TaxID=13765 RepID=A0AAV1HRD5_XYRNO|nr:Hypothetical predicted protein [Xyrichtys novacula]
MPPGPFAGHMKDGPGKDWGERGGGIVSSSDLAFSERKFNDMQGGKSTSDQQGLANQSVRRVASCSFWTQRKSSPEQVVQRGASGATEEEKKKKKKEKKKMVIKEIMCGCSCSTAGLWAAFLSCFASQYYA